MENVEMKENTSLQWIVMRICNIYYNYDNYYTSTPVIRVQYIYINTHVYIWDVIIEWEINSNS